MDIRTKLREKIFSVDQNNFDVLALKIFKYQALNNSIYRKYIDLLNIKPDDVRKVADIPFLPVELFKQHNIVTGNLNPEIIFESSRTSGIASLHLVADLEIYKESIIRSFSIFFGAPENYIFLALLPSYLERSGSSLVYMMNYLMQFSGDKNSGWYLNNFKELNEKIKENKNSEKKIFLLGVSFALLDFARQYHPDLSGHIVMETGGMKGRRKELIRTQLHDELKGEFNLNHISSEYGMTEMLSQAYSVKSGRFNCPPWMKILIRESNDPLALIDTDETGNINIIDLANIDSCSFLSLQDIGRKFADNSFEVLGRADYSEVRGCGLMYI
jgi:phenylacetate-coenzyme A ligase PaaK-like adenylate-forming protein